MTLYPLVVYVLPFHIYLPNGIYDVVLAGKTHRIAIDFLPNQETPYAPIVWDKIGFALDHDIFGRTGNSEFNIFVNEPLNNPVLEDALKTDTDINTQVMDDWKEKQSSLIDDAVKIGNRLLEVYRDQDLNNLNEPSFHIIPVTKADVSNIRLHLVEENHSIKYTYVEVYGKAMHLAKRSEVVVQTIGDFLKNETQIPVSRILTRQAEYSLWRGDYRLVPIEINTVFEMTVDTVLNYYTKTGLPQNNKPELLMEKLKTIQKLSNDYRKSIGKPEIRWFTAKNWGELKKFKGVADYRQEIINWLIDCYKLRNDSVHKGSFTVTQSEAEAALNSAKKAIIFLQTLDEI